MKVTPTSGPAPVTMTTSASVHSTSARDNAIAVMEGRSERSPVRNPSQVAPEELGAIQAPRTQQSEDKGPEDTVSAEATKPATPETPKEAPISDQYAVLARRERAQRQRIAQEQASIKAERESLERAKAELAAKDAEYRDKYIPKERLTEDTITTLLENGVSYDQLTEMMLNKGTAHQDPVLKQQLAEIKAQLKAQRESDEAYRKTQKDAADAAQATQYKEALRQITREAQLLVKADPQFEAIRETGSVRDVVDLIEKTFKEDGIMLSVEEAASEVEGYLVEQLSKYSRTIKKLQQKTNPQTSQQAAPQQSANKQAPQQQGAKTLTNSMGASGQLTARQRAVLAFEGKLNR